jgi:hypothetical protein
MRRLQNRIWERRYVVYTRVDDVLLSTRCPVWKEVIPPILPVMGFLSMFVYLGSKQTKCALKDGSQACVGVGHVFASAVKICEEIEGKLIRNAVFSL